MNEVVLGTYELDEATLRADDVRAPPAPSVRMPAAMHAYRCNERGCCCGGWRIPFRPADLVRLHRVLDDGRREKLLGDVELSLTLDGDGETRVKEIRITRDGDTCRFLDEEGHRCEIHAAHGLEALPDLCVDFPVATYDQGAGVDFAFDPVCPSVLDAIEASSPPYLVSTVPAPYADRAFELRASHTRGRPLARLGAHELAPEQLDLVRSRVLASLAEPGLAAWQHLHRIDVAYARVAKGERAPAEFSVDDPGDPAPYLGFLGQAIGANGAGTFERAFDKYRRFVFAIPLDEPGADWDLLPAHLHLWGPAMEHWFSPGEDALQPLLVNWLAHRNFAPFVNVRGELAYAAGTIAHVYAAALRYASAIGAVRGRVVDVPTMKVALGAGEYLYRSLEVPPDSLPWFALAP